MKKRNYYALAFENDSLTFLDQTKLPFVEEYITTDNSKLVPVAPQAPKAGPTVTIDLEKQQLIGVKTEPVRKIDLAKVVRASGKIAYDPELVVTQEEFIQALNNEDMTVYGTGKQSRCFLHVKDVINTLIKLMNSKDAIGQVFNIGSQEEITIENLAKKSGCSLP